MAAHDPKLTQSGAHDPELEVEIEIEVVHDDLTDPWFELGESEAQLAALDSEVFEIDPVHPLRRLGSWVRRVVTVPGTRMAS
jgi:hypothetical protein